MTSYFIFKTNKVTGKTTSICCGSHETEELCRIHWQSYMYGFMDGAFDMLGRDNFQMMQSREHKLGFEFHVPAQEHTVELFMLLNEDGHQLIQELCKAEATCSNED